MASRISELLFLLVFNLIGGSEANTGMYRSEADTGKCITNYTQIIPSKSQLDCMLSCLNEMESCTVLSYSDTERWCGMATTWEISDCVDNTTSKLNTSIADTGQMNYDWATDSPERVIDGVAESALSHHDWCCPCTQDLSCYITLDLGAIHTVLYLVLWSKPDYLTYSYKYQVSNMEFKVSTTIQGLDSPISLCFYRPGTPDVQQETFYCTTEILGRYVKATRLETTGYLCFVELEVHGYEFPPARKVTWSVV